MTTFFNCNTNYPTPLMMSRCALIFYENFYVVVSLSFMYIVCNLLVLYSNEALIPLKLSSHIRGGFFLFLTTINL